MSRFLFATTGSLGDLHPYIAIGRVLIARGHEAVIAAAEEYRAVVEGAGVEFAATRPRLSELGDYQTTSAPSALMSFLARARTPTRVLIPGCGSGYEVRAFAEAGHDVTAIEFSAPAVVRARELLGSLGDKVIQGDFFTHDLGERRYGLIYERAFLCSLPPARWPDYALRMASLLLAAGRLVGLFFYGKEPEPPPFPLTEETAARLLGSRFRLACTEPVEDSLPM